MHEFCLQGELVLSFFLGSSLALFLAIGVLLCLPEKRPLAKKYPLFMFLIGACGRACCCYGYVVMLVRVVVARKDDMIQTASNCCEV